MPELSGPDGRYLFAVQGDKNEVLYDTFRDPWEVIWDRWTHEASGRSPAVPHLPVPPAPVVPIPATGAGRLIRVTGEQDGALLNRGYSYWPASFVAGNVIHAFVGHADGRPRFFTVHRETGAVERRGPVLGYSGTGEAWYWSRTGAIFLCDGPRLRRVQPFSGDDRVVLDISQTFPGCRLWQAHSDDSEHWHSATVERITSEGPYQRIGTIVGKPGGQEFFTAQGVLDESQIDRSGRFLVIKEDDDNRIIDLHTGDQRVITNAQGAFGHSDCGPGFLVGENDQRGACEYLELHTLNRRVLFSTWNMGHVSMRGGRCLLSNDTHLSLVALNGSGVLPLIEHGMVGSGYDFQVHANLSPDGSVAAFVSNKAGRMDLYLLLI